MGVEEMVLVTSAYLIELAVATEHLLQVVMPMAGAQDAENLRGTAYLANIAAEHAKKLQQSLILQESLMLPKTMLVCRHVRGLVATSPRGTEYKESTAEEDARRRRRGEVAEDVKDVICSDSPESVPGICRCQCLGD